MLKCIFKRLLYGYRANSKIYTQYIQKLGAKVGRRVMLFDPQTIHIDLTRPELIEIGDDVQITRGVTILTHGYDWSVLKGVYGDVLGSSGKVKIGNNVFIGNDATILKQVTIGSNVIIGAGSVVTHDIPDNCVAAGNPARVIMSLETYYEKRQKAQYDEAAELVREYRRAYGKDPDDDVLNEFFWLFCNDPTKTAPSWEHKMALIGNYEKSMEKFKEHAPMFPDKNAFLNSIP